MAAPQRSGLHGGEREGSESPELWSLWVAWPSDEACIAPGLFPLPFAQQSGLWYGGQSRGWPGDWWDWSRATKEQMLLPLPNCCGG